MDLEQRLESLEARLQALEDRLGARTDPEKQGTVLGEIPVDVYANVLKGLANPMRLTLLARIQEKSRYNSELARMTGLAPAPLNFHLTTLKSSGLISQEAPRGKYVITALGLETLRNVAGLADRLNQYQTVELDRYCVKCGKARMKIDIYPTYFQGWCPACGGEHGKKWTSTGMNPYGEDWKHKDLDDFVDEGWRLEGELLSQAISEGRCINCGARINFQAEDHRITGTCPACGNYHCKSLNNATMEAILSLSRKYKKIGHKVEGPLKKHGTMCWKATITTPDGTLVQYLETRTGRLVEEINQIKQVNKINKIKKAS